MEQDWSSELEDIADEAQNAFHDRFKEQMDTYIERLEDAEEIPSRILTDAASLKRIAKSEQREETPSPTSEFEKWVQVNVLYDSGAQIEEMEQLEAEWMNDALILIATENLLELDTDISFDPEDRNVLRWLSNRSRRSAELIQGVSDERVLMSLWDVVYEGNYSIQKASEALQNEYAFSESRSETIARTEIISAGRAGQFHSDAQSGMVIGKRWRSADQENTRNSHREADQQVVPFDDPFVVKGEELMFPGDGSLGASADNTINCRCWYKRILEGEEDQL